MKTEEERSEFNLNLLRESVEWVEEQNELMENDRVWNQGRWNTPAHEYEQSECGTVYCLAGYIIQKGNSFSEFTTEGMFKNIDGCELPVSDGAAMLLGVELEESDLLFYGGNDAEDIRRNAAEISLEYGKEL